MVYFDEIPIHCITSEVLGIESQLEGMRVVMQADPVCNQLKQKVFQGWPDARGSVLETSDHSGTTGVSCQ